MKNKKQKTNNNNMFTSKFFNNNNNRINNTSKINTSKINTRRINTSRINTNINNNVSKSPFKYKLYSYLLIFLVIIVAPLGLIGFIIYKFTDKSNDDNSIEKNSIKDWLPNATDKDKLDRTETRGTIISCLLCANSLLQACLKAFGASSPMLLLLFGFIMTNVIGFMGDQGYGTDEGFGLYQIGKKVKNKSLDGISAAMKYIFGTLVSNKFWRYIITVFLDMFISAPLQSVIIAVLSPFLIKLSKLIPNMPFIVSGLLKFVLSNIDNVLQSFVAFITFLAYTNETRFKWAYASSDIDPSLLIASGTIKLAVTISGLVYLVSNITDGFNIVDIMDGSTVKTGSSMVDTLPRKLIFVIIIILLLTFGSMNESSFMNEKENKYRIGSLNDYKNSDYWQYNRDINKKYDSTLDNKEEICKIGINEVCETDKYGNLTVDTTNNKFEITHKDNQDLDNWINNTDNISTDIKKQWNLDQRPCYIPSKTYNEKCSVATFANTDDESKILEINKDTIAKPIRMAVFKHKIISKYDIMEKWMSGFVVFCGLLFIGVCLPFFPSKFIYNDNELHKAKLYKFLIILALCGGICFLCFILLSKKLDVQELEDKENELINESETK
jgi:hypothetical protein